MRSILCLLAGLLAPAITVSFAAQSDFPKKPVRIIVGFPAGGTSDTVARVLGQEFARAWGRPVVIFNLPGAAGSIAADRVAKAEPDGYTLGLAGETLLVIRPALYKVGYDPVKDFAPISQVTVQPVMLVVHNAVHARTVQELITLAKTRPGDLTFASGGSGTTAHLTGEMLKSTAGIDIRHIPYKGAGLAIPDLLGGRVTMIFSPIGILLPLVHDGKVRAIAVTSLRRSRAAPEVPTIAESGYPGFDVTVWYGLLAPARTPGAIVSKLHGEAVRALALADVRAKFDNLGVEALGNSPGEFAAVIKSGIPKWAKIIKASGIRPE